MTPFAPGKLQSIFSRGYPHRRDMVRKPGFLDVLKVFLSIKISRKIILKTLIVHGEVTYEVRNK